jgi:hypothetical protein
MDAAVNQVSRLLRRDNNPDGGVGKVATDCSNQWEIIDSIPKSTYGEKQEAARRVFRLFIHWYSLTRLYERDTSG